MKREYKGFYIESAGIDGYSAYHVVTGNLACTAPTIKDTKDFIDEIHTDFNSYARLAGCKRSDLERHRGRLRYAGWRK